jgi:hypothetical protein
VSVNENRILFAVGLVMAIIAAALLFLVPYNPKAGILACGIGSLWNRPDSCKQPETA